MVFEDVELPSNEDSGYWNPEVKDEYIEGNLCGTLDSKYNENRKRMILETPEENQVILPDTTILNRYLKGLEIGDYIRVIYKGEKENDDPNYSPTKLYKIQKDPERFVEYEIE